MFKITKADELTQIPDRCSFGIGFEIDTKSFKHAISTLPHRFKIRVKDKGETKVLKFEFYEETGLVFHYFNRLNPMKMTRKALINEKYIKAHDLEKWVSTNGNDNFIPLAIRKQLGSKLRTAFVTRVLPGVIKELKARRRLCLTALQTKDFRAIKFKALGYFKLTSTEICLDFEASAGFSFDRDNEYERRMAHLIFSGKRGNYVDGQNLHQVAPDCVFATFKAHGRDGVPCNITEMHDGSVLCAYIKEKPEVNIRKWQQHAWLMRIERRYSFDFKNKTSGGYKEELSSPHIANVISNRRFRTEQELGDLFDCLATYHFDQIEDVLTQPFPGNHFDTMRVIHDLIERYAPYRSRALIEILTNNGSGKLTAKVAREQFNYDQIRELERQKIIRREREPIKCADGKMKNYGRYFVLNWWKKFRLQAPTSTTASPCPNGKVDLL
jgi:hypothetical protein